VFHIDFGHVLGRGVAIDTGPFAITPEFKEVLEQWYKWHAFVDLCEKAYWNLRLHAPVLVDFAELLLRPLFPDCDVRAFCSEKLMLDKDLVTACQSLRKKLYSAPGHYKTRFKNFVHGANTSITKLRQSRSNTNTSEEQTNRPCPEMGLTKES